MPLPILALVPLIASVAPELIRFFSGDRAGRVADAAADAVKAITGTDDPAEAAAALADPAKATELRVELARIAADAEAQARAAEIEELKAYLSDTASARGQVVSLAQAGSKIAWAAPIVSVLAVAVFALAVAGTILIELPPRAESTAAMLLGAAAAGYGQVLAFWLGSSAGSARKDERLAAIEAFAARKGDAS